MIKSMPKTFSWPLWASVRNRFSSAIMLSTAPFQTAARTLQ